CVGRVSVYYSRKSNGFTENLLRRNFHVCITADLGEGQGCGVTSREIERKNSGPSDLTLVHHHCDSSPGHVHDRGYGDGFELRRDAGRQGEGVKRRARVCTRGRLELRRRVYGGENSH